MRRIIIDENRFTGGCVGWESPLPEDFEWKVTSESAVMSNNVSINGRSYIAGPQKCNNLIATSAEARRNSPSFPLVGPPQECLLDAKIRIADAFGYWATRSFRASETIAAAYVALYRSLGGRRLG